MVYFGNFLTKVRSLLHSLHKIKPQNHDLCIQKWLQKYYEELTFIYSSSGKGQNKTSIKYNSQKVGEYTEIKHYWMAEL